MENKLAELEERIRDIEREVVRNEEFRYQIKEILELNRQAIESLRKELTALVQAPLRSNEKIKVGIWVAIGTAILLELLKGSV